MSDVDPVAAGASFTLPGCLYFGSRLLSSFFFFFGVLYLQGSVQKHSTSVGVPIGTDAFVPNLVDKTCKDIIDDVEKLDAIQDGFLHY